MALFASFNLPHAEGVARDDVNDQASEPGFVPVQVRQDAVDGAPVEILEPAPERVGHQVLGQRPGEFLRPGRKQGLQV